jgi:hypothetical protein
LPAGAAIEDVLARNFGEMRDAHRQ